ncbi:hypothetical protein CGLAMM_08715 [Acetobacteraceae bacterium EV16G]|uniref:Uncharacterized protein n=1 Tax=Sorlinia euscelidii TaxID=3081148 RepID=A0ABU7TZV7_9PROT
MLNNCLVRIYTFKQDTTIAKASKYVVPWYEGVSPSTVSWRFIGVWPVCQRGHCRDRCRELTICDPF